MALDGVTALLLVSWILLDTPSGSCVSKNAGTASVWAGVTASHVYIYVAKLVERSTNLFL